MIFILSIAFISSQQIRNKKPESHINVFENKDFAIFVISSEHAKILELTQYQKSDKALFIIYGDFQC